MKELLDKLQLIREQLSEVRWADDLPEDASVELEIAETSLCEAVDMLTSKMEAV